MDANTVFRVGSLSKGFAGVLSGILVSQGTLAWDEPVQQLVPEFKLRDRAQTGRIQLWHLLSHTTGLPYHAYTHLIEQGYDIPTLMKYRFPTVPLAWKRSGTLQLSECGVLRGGRNDAGRYRRDLPVFIERKKGFIRLICVRLPAITLPFAAPWTKPCHTTRPKAVPGARM